jgi:hypothetical protein
LDFVLPAVFVDDILIASADIAVISHVKRSFGEKFKIKDMGPAEEFLNIRHPATWPDND